MWVGSAQITEPGINPEHSGPISAQNIFFFFGPKDNANYLQNVNSGSRSACNRNGCRNWRLTEEWFTQSRSLGRDQED